MTGRIKIMKALGFKIGHFTVTSAFKANYARIKNAEIKSKSYTLEARRASRMRKKPQMSILQNQKEATAKRNRRSKASDLSRRLSSATGTTVSRQTVYRRLGHIGLYARRPVRCVPLTATHCRLRLTWRREHALWTPQQWSFVIFSDESRISLQPDSCRTLIWRAPGTRYHQENTITMVQDDSFGEELFVVQELTSMFRV
ncbi:HTH_Tnp_Tc3_2 domain-containing protein [Trichonephila clavipes]|nr:HTH_Tnp_Tc3_2 domain-containing protein [Trichonephila clavipes]